MNWTTERPTKAGSYWFYGWLFGKSALHEGDDPELDLVSVHYGRNKSLTFVAGSSFIFKNQELGVWTECITPDLPNIYDILED